MWSLSRLVLLTNGQKNEVNFINMLENSNQTIQKESNKISYHQKAFLKAENWKSKNMAVYVPYIIK